MNNSDVKYEKEELYYYTSLNTLQTILQKKTARLTDYRFLNDTQELLFATKQLKDYLVENNISETTAKILNVVKNVENGKIQNFIFEGQVEENPIVFPTICDASYYVMSLSHSRDDLMMWKMYAPEGCCLKFNSKKFFEFFYSFRDNHFIKGLDNIIRGDVSYGPDYNVNEWVNIISSPDLQLMLYYQVLNYCLRRKDTPFAFEQEYRIAIPFIENYLDNSCSREFIIGNTMVKPQIELKNFPITEILEEVIISPFIKSEMTYLGIRELLKAHNISPNIVHESNILIR